MTLSVMALGCALLLAGVLFLRLNEVSGAIRLVILIASLAMTVFVVVAAGRLTRSRR